MEMGAATLLNPASQSAISRSDLLRLEGLGDNCELGFVLRRLGFEDGMLFRWASISPESLLATLRGNFEQLYEFEDLVPRNPTMVRDLHYGTSWHTQMHSTVRAEILSFDAPAEVRRDIHARELAKLDYLVGKLKAKFRHPNPVFVVKANQGIASEVLEAIHYQLYRRAESPQFLLLDVHDDPARAGSVELVNRNRMKGFVRYFAPYDYADEGDDESWIAILRQALAHNAAQPNAAESRCDVLPNLVRLPFPALPEPSLAVPMIGDLRGGMPSLIGGNAWCRIMDEDTYRLHATMVGTDATTLRWTGVHLPAGCVLTLRAACAVPDSLPVKVTLELLDANGPVSQGEHIFRGMREEAMAVSTRAGACMPAIVSLIAQPLAPLRSGERAVIDLTAITAIPSSNTRSQL